MAWSSLRSIPGNICLHLPQHLDTGRVACGFNSLCSIGTDWSCRRNFTEQDCKDESRGDEAFTMHEMLNTNWIEKDCWKKRYPLLNGRTDPTETAKAFLKISTTTNTTMPRSQAGENRKNQSSLIISVSKKATNGFEEELGTGALSTVYKAILNDENGKIVDVKKLQKTVTEGEQGFLAEVNSISRNNHKNLVQLLGFCNEGQHRLLVYEHMETGSLADLLFKDSRLNEGLTATIAGFGIAKLMRKDQTRTTTKIRGIRGYAAPEWFRNMPITVKVDVYSFGILLLELICCRKSYKQDVANENEMILAEWVCDCYRRKELHLLAGDDEEPIEDIKRFEKLLMVAIWCIQENPALRPRMKKVMLTLEGSVEVSIHPDPFSFI
ncbi:G-type lectin S-receptor-like serine/threonine-protein kinase LECRK2 [Capsicum annuum]